VGAFSRGTTVGSTLKLTAEEVPELLRPVPAVTPLIVPVPGNVCPLAKAIWPVGAMDRPVAAGAVVPEPNSSSRLAEGLAVLFPELAACQTNFSATAALAVLEYTPAPNWNEGELAPAAAVAAAAGRLTAPRRVLAPFTSRVVAGTAVAMPTLVPDSAMTELPSVDVPVHTGTKPLVPLPVGLACVLGCATVWMPAATADFRSSCVT